jgi:biopolymer transport protein ExbD
MAYKPSLRRASNPQSADLDIRPVMNLMVVLIPLLLAGAEFVKLSVIEVNLPPRQSGGGGGGKQNDKPQEKKEKKLQLSLAVTDKGIYIASPAGVLGGEANAQGDETGPTVPVTSEGKHNLKVLKDKLIDIKKKIAGQDFKDNDVITLTAAKDTGLQVIIDIMDVVQTYKDESGQPQELFPKVQFGKVM